MTTPSFIVYVENDCAGTRLNVVFYPGRPKGHPERPVSVSKDRLDVDIRTIGKAEIKNRIETTVMKSEIVSREYPVQVRAWNKATFLVEDWKWRVAVKWKGRRI